MRFTDAKVTSSSFLLYFSNINRLFSEAKKPFIVWLLIFVYFTEPTCLHRLAFNQRKVMLFSPLLGTITNEKARMNNGDHQF